MRPFPPGTKALRTFEAAGRWLNFTRAADDLGLTPAAVSHQIKEMEAQLGFQLFTRSSRSMQLTPAGAVLLEASAEALELLRRATGRARRLVRGQTQLRLSLGARFATHWLLPRLPDLRALHPQLELSFDISDAVRDFDADDVDVAIRFGTGSDEHCHTERLFAGQVVPVCSPVLLAAGPRPKHPADLVAHTLCHVDCTVDGQLWPNWALWMSAAGVPDFDDNHSLAFTDTSHVVQAVLKGQAVGLVEEALVAAELDRGELVRLFDIGVSLDEAYAYHLVYPEHHRSHLGIAALQAWMLEVIGAGQHGQISQRQITGGVGSA